MIDCRRCNFSIKSTMRHALVNNCCPACGSAILGETHVQRMRLFKQRLMQQEFSQSMSEDLIFDVTLFMLLEFSPLSSNSDSKDEAESANIDSEQAELEAEAESAKEDYEKIRDQIREEVLSDSPESSEDLEEELKIARLKRLAKESKVRRSGTSVRRLGSD